VAEFYEDHDQAPYFSRLVDHMSGGPVVVYVLCKRNYIEKWQKLIGPADVSRAKRLLETVRTDFLHDIIII